MEIITRTEARNLGLNRYFTGKPCKRGHISERVTSGATCIECRELTSKKLYEENREERKQKARDNYHKDKENKKARVYEWRNRNKDRYSEWKTQYEKNRRRTDPVVKAKRRMRHFLFRTLKLAKQNKDGRKTADVFGYTPKQLKEHLESLFTDGMTWENQGEWHIDHIKPLSSFDLSDSDQVREANALDNLRPLWADDNLSKGAKIY